MSLFLQFSFVTLLLLILHQDFKERKVTILLLLLCGVIGATLQYQNTTQFSFIMSTGINSSFLGALILFLWGYTHFKMKQSLFSAIGLGDFLFFFVLGVSFPTVTFFLLFATSLLFSLLIFLLIKSYLQYKTVPLAGLQALFISSVFVINKLGNFVNLYAL